MEEKYLRAAELLAKRNINLQNDSRDPIEQETDRLFYWVLSRLEWTMDGFLVSKNHYVVLEITDVCKDGSIILSHGTFANYISRYVKGSEFRNIMKRVANIFDKIEKKEMNGEKYYFASACFNDVLLINMYAH